MRSDRQRDAHAVFAIVATIVLIAAAMFFGYSAAVQRDTAATRHSIVRQ
jgi:hypothetical protein